MLSEFSSIEVIPSMTLVGDTERGNVPHWACVVEVGVLLVRLDPMDSVDMRRYSCFSHRVFHAWSSLTSSLQRLETDEARTKVFGSSTYSST